MAGETHTPLNLSPRDLEATLEPVELSEAVFGANRRPAGPPALVVMGPGEEFTVTNAVPGTRLMLMAGKPYGEVPMFNGPFVD